MPKVTKIGHTDPRVTYTGGAWSTVGSHKKLTKGADVTVQLEDAASISYGSGVFGTATALSTSGFVNLTEGVDFEYGKRLDASAAEDPANGFGAVGGGVIDTGVAGALAGGKSIRVVEATKNVVDATGLNLDVYATPLSAIASNDPPTAGTIITIDPDKGNFILPKPYYYNGLLNAGEIATPTIRSQNAPSTTVSLSGYSGENTESVQFAKGWYVQTSTNNNTSESGEGWRKLYTGIPAAPVGFNVSTHGTVSFWAKTNVYWGRTGSAWPAGGNAYSYTGFIISEALGISIRIYRLDNGTISKLYLYINNAIVATSVANITNDTTYHVYGVWDQAKGLTGGKSVRVFLNGVESVSTTNDLPSALPNTSPCFWMYSYAYSYGFFTDYGYAYARSSMSNLKYFTHVVSEDPTWEYNAGTGREFALHSVYGATNGYIPKLIAPGGVGYFKAGSSGNYSTVTF